MFRVDVQLQVTRGGSSGLLLRPWVGSDMEALCAQMAVDYPTRGLHPPGPRDASEAAVWLAVQDGGWSEGDWLSFAVLERQPRDRHLIVGQVALKSREAGRRVAACEIGEVSYWTVASARGRGIAPAAVDAMTRWAFETFPPAGLKEVMAVHDVDNPASCRVAEKSGYPFECVSPPNPPLWFTAGHIHRRRRPGGR